MLVSMWHFSRRIRPDFELSDLLEAACEGTCLSGPIWDHVLGYWNASKASPETVLFLRYEESCATPLGTPGSWRSSSGSRSRRRRRRPGSSTRS
jgi:hypothetical protein